MLKTEPLFGPDASRSSSPPPPVGRPQGDLPRRRRRRPALALPPRSPCGRRGRCGGARRNRAAGSRGRGRVGRRRDPSRAAHGRGRPGCRLRGRGRAAALVARRGRRLCSRHDVDVTEPPPVPALPAKPADRRYWDAAHHAAELARAHQAVLVDATGVVLTAPRRASGSSRMAYFVTPPCAARHPGVSRAFVLDGAERAGLAPADRRRSRGSGSRAPMRRSSPTHSAVPPPCVGEQERCSRR